MEKQKRRYKKKVQWSIPQEQMLIAHWENHIGELRGARKKAHIFKEITNELSVKGVHFNEGEIKYKMHNLTNKYRDEKRKIGPSGGAPSNWPHYYRMHSLLGGFKSNMMEEMMEESCETLYQTEEETLNETLDETLDETLEVLLSEQLDEDFQDFEVLGSEDDTVNNSVNHEPTPKKQHKNELAMKLEETNQILKDDIMRQKETDNKLLSLQTEVVEIERERNEILKTISKNNSEMQAILLKAINENV